MIAGRISRGQVHGKSQGYLGLAVRHELYACGTPVMTTAWIPTPAELDALNRGACVHVIILGDIPAPMRVEVGEIPDDQKSNNGNVG